MSVIPTTGAEDYTRTTEHVGTPLLNVANKSIAADDTSAVLDVSNWEAVQIRSPQLSSPPGWTFTFNWYAELAASTLMGTRVYRSGQGHPIGDSTVNQGPFLQVVVHATSYAGSPSYSLQVAPRNGHDYSSRNTSDGSLVNSSASVLAAGVVVFGTTRIATGRALWEADSTAATNWVAVLSSLDEAGTARTIAYMDGVGGHKGVSQMVLLPAFEVEVIMANTDAGTQTLHTSLVLEM